MDFYTGYYAKTNQYIAAGYTPVAISRVIPKWYIGLTFQYLAPDAGTIGDLVIYRNKIIMLDRTFIEYTISHIFRPVLLCYESLDKPCHRHVTNEVFDEKGELIL